MAIEDLPIIKAKDIHQKSPVIDRAEVIYNSGGGECQPDMFERRLFLVLGKGKYKYVYFDSSTKTKDGIFVVTEMCHYGLVELDYPVRGVGYEFPLSFKHIPLESINDYVSLIPEKKIEINYSD